MKQIRTRISAIIMCLLVGISMLAPAMTQVHANELYSQLNVNIANKEGVQATLTCSSDVEANLPCFNQSETTLQQNQIFVIDQVATDLPNHVFKGADDATIPSSIYAINYNSVSNSFEYKENKDSQFVPYPEGQTPSITYHYQQVVLTDFTPVEGYDSTTDGITMNLFNYTVTKGASTNNINYNHPFKFVNADGGIRDDRDWNKNSQSLRQGLVEPTLENGYPKVTVGKFENLSYLFDPTEEHSGKTTYTNVNKLLQRTADGSYVYDSQKNFAMFNDQTNEFILTNELGAPKLNEVGYNKGNFFPFNTIKSTNASRLENDKLIYNIIKPDYHFGLTMQANFLQPKDGVYHNSDMVFEFSGDDDVWVFIDDVLVLDLGGIHPAQSGSINFASGDVIVNGNKSTTIKQQFENANASASFDGNTFADFTEHSVKFFYLERGAGASNCKLRINLPIMPKNGFAVSKQVSNINEATPLNDTYTFRAYVDANNNGEYSDDELLRSTPYQIGDETYSTDADGLFTLQAGQMAEFKEQWTENLPFKVEEVNIDANRYQNVTMTSNNGVVGSYDSATGIASSGSLTIGQHVLVAFNNEVSDALTSSLQIQKNIKNGKNDDAFQMIAKINGEVYQGSYTVNNGTETRTESANDGIITIKQNEIATIEKLPADTTFEVVESLTSVNAEYQKYSDDVTYEFDASEPYGVNEPVIENGAKGSIVQGKATLLHVTNTLIYGKLQVVKQIDAANFANGDPIFTFKIERLNKNGETINTLYRSVRFDSTLNAQSFIIDGLPLGDYRVSELTTLRYLVVGDVTLTDTIKEADQTIVFNYNNRVVNDQYYSHTDIVSNQVEYKKDENGKITDVIISQDTLETPAE